MFSKKNSLLAITIASLAINTGTMAASLTVKATVLSTCSIDNAALDFGTYDVLSTSATAGQTNLTYRCTKGVTPKISLNKGGGDSITSRKLKYNNDTLSYSLLKPVNNNCSNATENWGDTNGTWYSPSSPTPGKADQNVLVCGSISPGQDVPAGTYTDTVTITIAP